MNRSCLTQTGLVLLLAVSMFCPALYAGFKPEQQVISTQADGASCVYAADLDGDGDLDVLSASSDDDKIAWYANDGTGQFGPQQVITTKADGANSVYAADLDGDGDLDVLSASREDKKIAWYANDGTGCFGPQQVIITEADGANSVYAADLDNDGDLDVLSAFNSYYDDDDDKIAWYANDGTGHFGPQQVITTEAWGANCVYAADLDGDGDLDVLSAGDVWIAWYPNDGSGHFGPQEVITMETWGASCVYAADLDNDGDLDVLSAFDSDYSDAAKVTWYANDGTGRFGPRQVINTEADGANSVYVADLDGDGDLDVLSASGIVSMIAWYANDGTGQFGPQQVITTVAPSCVYAADLDGDGDADVLSASPGYDRIAWHENDGSGRFGAQQVITTEADGANSVYAADLDGDGDLDVLSASWGVWTESGWTDSRIAWYANDGTGHFGPQQVITTEAASATCVYAADLDGDGDLDVLSASWYDDKIAWYANDGAGQFGPQQAITTEAASATCVYAGDLDGDGDLDVLSASLEDDKIAWYANDGSGQFGPQQVITTAANEATCVYAADLDGDGDVDVLSASVWRFLETAYASPQIAWYANDGKGQFGPSQGIWGSGLSRGARAPGVHAADLDGDGDLDILSASTYDSRIAWHANDGTGRFGAQHVITGEAPGANCVYAADLDGDGDLDVLSASAALTQGAHYAESRIAWYANDGTGQFGPQQVITTAADGANCVYAADLDGDGDLDVLSASSGDDKIAWYENE